MAESIVLEGVVQVQNALGVLPVRFLEAAAQALYAEALAIMAASQPLVPV